MTKHLFAIVKQDQFDRLWNATPPELRMTHPCPFGPVLHISTPYANVFILSCGSSEPVSPDEIDEERRKAVEGHELLQG